MKIKEIYNRWKAEKKEALKPTSYSTYVLMAEKHILPVIGEAEAIDEEGFKAFLKGLEEKGCSAKTTRDCGIILMGIIRYAAKNGWWPMPTWSNTKGVAKKAEKPEVAVLSIGQQKAIAEYCVENRNPRNIGIYLALTTGLRVGELCSLRWDDIDLENNYLHLCGTVSRHYEFNEETESRSWSTGTPTDTGARAIPLASAQVEFLRPEEGQHLRENYIFSNTLVPADPRVVRTYAKAIFKTLGIKGHQYKDFRHSFAVRCLQCGCDYPTLAKLLGTDSIENLVKTYKGFVKENPRAVMEAFMKGM